MSRINFTPEQDAYIKETIDSCATVYDLTEMFNARFPEHTTNRSNIGKRMQKLGVKKGTHNIRADRIHSVNPIGTVIRSNNHSARVKTECGYIQAGKYFRKLYGIKSGAIIHLDGNCENWDRENLEIVDDSVYHSMCWRGWFFKDRELTKTAVLTAMLLMYFNDIRHNENQYYGH